jgi:hypothetical protein
MASSKTFVARKDFTLDCGHTVKKGDEFVITSVFTCKRDSATVAAVLKWKDKPWRTRQKSWRELLMESLFGTR